MSVQFGVSRFSLTAEIAGETHQLVNFQMSFALNTVPRASALMAVGRNARNVSEVAPIHKVANQLIYLQPAKIYMEAIGTFSSSNETWPDGRTLLFDGYLTGTSYQRSGSAVMLQLDFTHWLADLQFSSCVSDVSHPSNPYSYTHRAATTLPGAGGGGPTWLGQYAPDELFAVENIEADFWGQAIQPFFTALAKQDLFALEGSDQHEACFSREGGANRQALLALERMVGGSGSNVSSPSYVPLKFQPGPLGSELSEAVGKCVMNTLADSDFFQSFWDNLVVKLGPQFCFSLVPQIDKAFLAPVIPGLRTHYDREIYAMDQEFVSIQSILPRPLRAVGLLNSFGQECQANQGQDSAPADAGSGGCYAPAGAAEAKGQVLVVRAPSWLTFVTETMEITGATNSVYTKSATTPTGGGPKAVKSPNQALKDTKQLAEWYCQYVYMCEALRGRSGTLAGKFRLDIAPGSTVKIHASPERFLGGEDTLGSDLFATVNTVTCSLDAENGRAGTGFGLMHVRTGPENEDDKTSIPIHPLYAQAYTGAPLTDSQRFNQPSSNVLSGAPTQDVSGIA